MASIHDAHTIPARTMTVACQIDKHNLCNGEGNHVDTGEVVRCECPCHEMKAERGGRA